MYKGNTIGVVVPAYNEEGFVGEVIDTMPGFVDRVYVVDDASTDGTWAEIRRHAARANAGDGTESGSGEQAVTADGSGPVVVTVRHETNRGVGGAIKTGYLRAREDDLDVVTVMGGDGQMDPDLVDAVLEPIVDGVADYAKGNRLVGPATSAEMPRFRYVGNRLLSYLTKIASGYWSIGDPQNGYTAISGAALADVPIERMYEYYGYCNHLLVLLRADGYRVADVPMPASYGEEESHIAYHEYIPRVSWMLLRSFLWRVATAGSPLTQGGYFGSLLAGAVSVYGFLSGETQLAGVGLVLTVLLVVVGLVADRRDDAGGGVRVDGTPE
jgi:glycosyltransferase involved in cell wall biosynthesis